MNDRLKALFGDLGKPTLRGIRKCPNCGTYNGTRGTSCKNKTCNMIFKEPKLKKKVDKPLDGVKLITGSDSQIYSVQIREKGPEVRGFAVLPLIECLDGLQASPEVEFIVQSTSQCHIDSCPHSKSDFSDVSLNITSCRHVNAAISCLTEATALTLNDSVLESLTLDDKMKQEIWQLAAETPGPLVQRVSNSVMVVKCKVDEKHPLGYLHFYFFDSHRKQSVSARAVCECEMPQVLKPSTWKKGERCVHHYACMCAFLSDKKLETEFQSYIDLELFLHGVDSVALQNTLISKPDIQNTIRSSEPSDSDVNAKRTYSRVDVANKKKKRKEGMDTESADGDVRQRPNILQRKPSTPTKKSSKQTGSPTINELEANFSFLAWLGSVTERINQTMHFQFSGKPDPLVFHVPQIFFDCLQQRIPSSSMKKRLPNTTTTFTRKDALPLGVFTKYTWHITNIFHVKQIFDTPEVPLQVTQSFVENKDGTYDPYDPYKNGGKQLVEQYKKMDNGPLIKPLEMKTFLKVGTASSGTKEISVFTLEWIPDILPFSGIGEMRITFEYGHMRNVRNEAQIPAPCKVIRLRK